MKRPNPKAKAEQLAREWAEMLARHSKPLSCGAKAKGLKIKALPNDKVLLEPSPRRSNVPSLVTGGGSTALAAPKVYTGTKIIGIATMHKSNMVPIFNEAAAVEVAQMRRN